MSSLDYLDLCRLCLVKDQVSVPIFDGEGDVRQIFLKIAACLPVKLTRDDKLPKKICNDCVYKVELFYEFWNTTSNSEKQLMQWLGEVDVNDKQTYVTAVINQDQSSDNRLDGNVMQQTNEHQNNMGMNIIETMSLEMPMMMSTDQTQMTINTTNNSNSQSIQALPGTSAQQKDGMGESEEDNSDDDMDRDEGLPVKEEIIQDTNRIIEPGAFLNVSLPCDEPGPSGLQQQKNADIPDMVIGGQTTESDNKAGENYVDEGEVSSTLHRSTSDSMIAAKKKNIINCKRNSYSPKKLASYKCKICNSNFLNETGLLTHQKVSNCNGKSRGKKRKSTIEIFPEQPFTPKRRLLPFTDPFICHICDVELKSQENLDNHVMIHMNDGIDLFPRNKYLGCKKILKNDTQWVKEFEQFYYNCSLCKKKFDNFVYLQSHMMKSHPMARIKTKYTCSECNYQTYYHDGYKEHMWSHASDKRIPCDICGQIISRSNMKNHKIIHSSIKTEICEICGKSFALKTYLSRHKKIHSRQKQVEQ